MNSIVREWVNQDGSFAIKVYSDMSYQIVIDGEVINTNYSMNKWYSNSAQVVKHIQNDIDFGYYPKLKNASKFSNAVI
jgi:hypothetical protein